MTKRIKLKFKGLNKELTKWINWYDINRGYPFNSEYFNKVYQPIFPSIDHSITLMELHFIYLDEYDFRYYVSNDRDDIEIYKFFSSLTISRIKWNWRKFKNAVQYKFLGELHEIDKESALTNIIENSLRIMVNCMLDDRHYSDIHKDEWVDLFSNSAGFLIDSLRLYHLKCYNKDGLLNELYNLTEVNSEDGLNSIRRIATALSLIKNWKFSFLNSIINAEIRRLLSVYYHETEFPDYCNYLTDKMDYV